MFSYPIPILTCLVVININFNSAEVTDCLECQPLKLNQNVQFHLHTQKNPSQPYILQIGNHTNFMQSPFDRYDQTVLLIHGFGESARLHFCETLSSALFAYNPHTNIIRVDWSYYAAMPSYTAAAQNVKIVGPYTTHLIKWLQEFDAIDLIQLHVIGFSLGAHVAGFMARQLQPQKIGKITGLDPAGPFFEYTPPDQRLDKTDANFVEIIHTNSKTHGIESPIGHLDFYPNSGASQPGCDFPDIACSHKRSWAYYAEALLNPMGFPASKCQVWKPKLDKCTHSVDAFIGPLADQYAKSEGLFLLQTNRETPFARNMTDYPNLNHY